MVIKINKAELVALPSLVSFLVCFMLSVLLILSTFWSIAKNLPVFRETVNAFSPQADKISGARSSLDAVTTAVFNNDFSNQFFYILLWVLVGVLVYFLVSILRMGQERLIDVIQPKGVKGLSNKSLIHEYLLRGVFRVFILSLWLMFALLSLQFLLPLGVSSIQAASDINAWEDVKFFFLAFVVLFSTFHMHVVFLRLFLMRARVYAAADDIVLHDR